MSDWRITGGLFGLWIATEMGWLDPVGRAMGRMTNRWTVALLWIGAVAALGLMPYTSNAASPSVRTLGLVAIMGLTPLALMGAFTLRDRRRAERKELARIAAAQPRPEPVWHPAARVYRRSLDADRESGR
jgi:hypothetical protein